MKPPRTIIEELKVTEYLDSYKKENNREENDSIIDNIWDALTWSLSYAPEIGYELPNEKGYYVFQQDSGSLAAPYIVVVYSYDDINVIFKAIKIEK